MKSIYLVLPLSAWLAACTSLTNSFSQLTWQDQRGDRGVQVKQRDLTWCLESIETRHSLLASCMAERGWAQEK